MLARLTKARVGLSKYLRDGLRKDWKGVDRNMKDDVIPITGDLDLFAKTEKYLNDKKNYKYNYMHITLSFNDEDTKRLYDLPEDERDEIMENMVNDYVKHHFSGYDIDNEVIYYAERHRPKIKVNEKGNKRFEHIHIAIALYNPLNDTKLTPVFTKSSYMDSVLQSYVNKKYGLTNPRDYKRNIRKKDSQIAKDRKYYINELKNIKNQNELIDYFNKHNIEYKEVKTKRNHYYKIINPKGKDINLRGKGFEHLQKMTVDKNWVYPEKEELKKLEEILSSFYEKCSEYVSKRESKETRAKKEETNNASIVDNKNTIDLFKSKAKGQVAQRLKERDIKEEKNLSLTHTSIKKAFIEAEKRPTNPIDKEIKKEIDAKETEKAEKSVDIKFLKQALPAKTVLDYAVAKYGIDPNDYEIVEDNKINNKTNRQKPKNIIDFLQKEIYMSTKEAITLCQELHSMKPLVVDRTYEKIENIKEKGELMKPISISISKDKNINALKDWEQVQVKNYSQLATLVKQYPYSEAIFKDGRRRGANLVDFNNILIYDIDNDPSDPQLTINQAKVLLEKQDISAMIIPSKSHQVEKKTKDGKSKGKVDRYRIIIPTNKPCEFYEENERDMYKEFQRIVAEALNIYDYVDKQALNDRIRYYYKSPIEAQPIVIQSDRVMNIDEFEQKAEMKIILHAAEQAHVSKIQANMNQHRKVGKNQGKWLTYVDVQSIKEIPIETLIWKFEGGQDKDKNYEKYEEGDYVIIKTKNAKYSILTNDNLAYDFKSDITYNSLSYLQKQFGTTNLNEIARELEKITQRNGFIINNTIVVEEAVKKAMKTATNDENLQEIIKQEFGVEYVKLNMKNRSLDIADRVILFSQIGFENRDFINAFRKNREKASKKVKEKDQKIEQSEEINNDIQGGLR